MGKFEEGEKMIVRAFRKIQFRHHAQTTGNKNNKWTPLNVCLFYSILYFSFDDFRFHIWHDSNGEFADDGFGNDGFASRFGKGALDSVQGKRRMAPTMHQRLHLVVTVDQLRRSDVLNKGDS